MVDRIKELIVVVEEDEDVLIGMIVTLLVEGLDEAVDNEAVEDGAVEELIRLMVTDDVLATGDAVGDGSSKEAFNPGDNERTLVDDDVAVDDGRRRDLVVEGMAYEDWMTVAAVETIDDDEAAGGTDKLDAPALFEATKLALS